MDKNQGIVLIGPPGSGKGTQAEKLKKYFSVPHVSSGDVLRSEVSQGTEFGKKIKSYMDRGEIGPVELITDVILKHVQENCQDGFILDGFPRTIYQAEKLADLGPVDIALFISVPDEIIINRITGRRTCQQCKAIYHIEANPSQKENICDSCQGELSRRDDDTEETVINRIKVYNDETRPVLNFYEKSNLLQTIDGVGDPERIFQDLLKSVVTNPDLLT